MEKIPQMIVDFCKENNLEIRQEPYFKRRTKNVFYTVGTRSQPYGEYETNLKDVMFLRFKGYVLVRKIVKDGSYTIGKIQVN